MKVRRVCIAASLCRTVWLSLCLMRVRVCQWMHLDASAAMSHVYSFIQMCYRLLLVLWFKAATQIFPLTVPFVSHSKKKKGTSRPKQQIWADKISLDYKAHFTVSLTLDTLAPGLVRHADGNGDGAAVQSLPIIVCGICKRALAGSLRHDELRLHLPPMIALWTEYNRRFPNHWSDGTL